MLRSHIHCSLSILRKPLLFISFFAFFLPSLALTACGKKGEPSLSSYELPDVPASVNASRREDRIIVTWEFPVSREVLIDGFSLLRSSGQAFEHLASIESNKRSFIDNNFKEDIAYSYKIVSRSHKGLSSRDSEVISLTPSRQPSPPRNVTFQTSDGFVTLAWKSGGANVVYNVYKSIEKGVFGTIPLNKTPLTGNSFRDSLSLGKPSFYTIRSLWNKEIRDEGYPSAEIIIDPSELIPSAPRGLRSFVSSDRTYLYWNESDEAWVTGFRIYRRTGVDEYTFIGDTQIPSYVDYDSQSLNRDYRVSALGPSKEGPGTEIQVIISDNNR